MGYIQQSDTKKIYAYLTQLGKEKFIIGELEEFEIKYFSLHDDDINYYISAQNISASTYNIPKSGFISDITGDDDICLSNISEATLLKNKLLYFPPIVVPPGEYLVFTSCTDTIGGERFSITVYANPIPQGHSWYVKTDVISFPNSDSTIDDAIILPNLSKTSEKYPLNSPPVAFNASMKRTVPNGSGGFTTVLLGEDFLPRESDAYNFTVYVVNDNTDEIVFTREFKDINCSKKLFAISVLDPDVLANPDIANYTYNSPMPINNLKALRPTVKAPITKTGFALWVIDNGNRRRDLNLTQEDLDNDFNSSNYFSNSFVLSPNTAVVNGGVNFSPQEAGPATLFSPNGFNISFHLQSYNANDFYPSIATDRAITRPSFIRSSLLPNGDWLNYAPTIIDNSNYQSVRPQNYNPASFTERVDFLHPTVKVFNDWKNGVEGFTFRYYEFTPISDTWPLQTSPQNITPKQGRSIFTHYLTTSGFGPPTVKKYGNTYGSSDIGSVLVNGGLAYITVDDVITEFEYCVLLQGNYLPCF